MEQRRILRRHRAAATGLLLVMAGVYLALKLLAVEGFWTGLALAGAEAALVGGLADWFAVTALFRHPLWLPIPHTAIIPRNKDRLGQGIGRFLEGNFLAPDLVARKLRSLGLGARLGRWLAEPGNADAVAARLAAALPFVAASAQDRQLRAFARQALSEQLRKVDAAALFGRLLAILTARGHHKALFERVLTLLHRYLEERRDFIYDKVSERSHWLIPEAIDRRIAEAIMAGVGDLLTGLADENHEMRRRFDQTLADTIQRLQHDPAYRARGEALRDEVLGDPMVQQYLEGLWDRMREALLRDAADPASGLQPALAGGLRSLGAALAADPAMQARLERRIELFVLEAVVPHRAEIGRFIEEVVRGWDARTISDKIELAVGRDLQYIRVNGTLVGALVGCLLYLLSWAAF